MASESLALLHQDAETLSGPAGKKCFHCGAHSGVGDFCESCGTWLHPGCCRFCYAQLDADAKFCGECGNNQSGIECPQCRVRSFFDFCSGCFEPLTDRACLELKGALAALDADQSPGVADKGPPPAAVEPMDERQSPEPSGQPQAEPTAEQLVSQPAAQAASNQHATSVKADPQAARARIMAIKAALQIKVRTNTIVKVLVQSPTKWKCHRYGNIHPSPNQCAAPDAGGDWLFE